jgi:hypothetical protein
MAMEPETRAISSSARCDLLLGELAHHAADHLVFLGRLEVHCYSFLGIMWKVLISLSH